MPVRPRRAKLILLLASLGVSLLFAELALRIAGVSNPNFYRPDARRGWALDPDAQGWWRKEGNAYVRINGAGQRDDVEHTTGGAPGRLRIAVLGDSCVEALQVPTGQTFWKLLEKAPPAGAGAAPGTSFETLDFGVSGYGTAQELLTLRHDVFAYRPDLVLLAFYTGNDVRNNYRPLEQDPARPYFELAGDGRLVPDDAFRDSWGYRLRQTPPARLLYAVFNHSRLLGLAKQGESVIDGWVGTMRARRQETGAALQELGLDNAVYSPPTDRNWRAAWQVTEAMLLAMRDEAAAHHTPFAMVTLTTGIQVHPDPAARRAFAEKLGVPSLFYPDERLAAFGRENGIPVLTLAPALQELATRQRVFLHGFPNTAPGEGHWNARGHAAAAALLGPWLRSIVPPSSSARN